MADTGAATAKKRVVKPAEQRRREILDAALHLFLTKGFDETTVQGIARDAGVAIGTVYLYFSSKEHVLLGLHEEFHQGLEERFADVHNQLREQASNGQDVPYTEFVDATLDAEVTYCLEHKDVLEVIARYIPRPDVAREALIGNRRFIEAMAESFSRGMQKGILHTTDAEMTAYLLSTAVGETIRNSIVYGDPPDLDRLVAQAKELFHKALAPRTP
jgi:AcrR family transcriptional regulator